MTRSAPLPSRPLQIWPLFLWLMVQLGALGFGCSSFAVWPHHPQPRESLAAAEMVAVQIIGMALLFPVLLPRFSMALVAVVLAWPFVQMAGLLSDTPQSGLVAGSVYVSVWIFGLGWCAARSRVANQGLGFVAIVAAVTLGGVVLGYLGADTNGTAWDGRAVLWLSPSGGAIKILRAQPAGFLAWIPAAFPWFIAAVHQIFTKLFRSRRGRRSSNSDL